jgi:phage tail-like protein
MPSSTAPLGGEPTISSYFLFEVDGVEIGYFSEVTGLSVGIAVEQIFEGGQNGFVHQMPGRMSWPHLVFKRGITQSDALFTWMGKSSGEGFAGNGNKLTRSTGAVTVLDAEGTRLRAWEFDGVYPVRWTGPEFSVESNIALQEQLEVAHNGFKSKTQ